MNKPLAESDFATPKVTTGPIAGSRKIYSVPDAALGSARAAARDRALGGLRRGAGADLRSIRHLYRADVAIDVEKGLKRSARRMGEGARRRRGI